MGIHYVNPTLVGDDKVFPAAPELIVYEPTKHGRLRMVAARVRRRPGGLGRHAPSAPKLFGREFELVEEGNRYGLPAFYELHAWLWKHNPRGMHDDGTRGSAAPRPEGRHGGAAKPATPPAAEPP